MSKTETSGKPCFWTEFKRRACGKFGKVEEIGIESLSSYQTTMKSRKFIATKEPEGWYRNKMMHQ